MNIEKENIKLKNDIELLIEQLARKDKIIDGLRNEINKLIEYKRPMKKGVRENVAEEIIKIKLENPKISSRKAADQLKEKNIIISHAKVNDIWRENKL